MKVEVDLNKCQDHGQCVYAAPDLFALDDEGRLSLRSQVTDVYVADVDEASAEDLYEAAEVCPLQAITVHE
ncbi:ferredoxin [Streptomyces griseorubiginosus]|uniref:Ferredoxin n=1 Tax=Streptomyces griseorubiginosus TaxID=67304 RepID=A0A117R1G2_9ACTN|nr:ferredoxin [Streptomyces griseorubiginosus]KUN65806.1 ferredoxin [Streptomyces griseorubiginosus]